MSIELILVALGVPLVLWFLWMRRDIVTYRGTATALGPSVDVGKTGRNAFITLVTPGGKHLLGEIPVSRAAEFKSQMVLTADVVVRRRLFQQERIAEIVWPAFGKNERAEAQNGEKDFAGLALAAFYLLAGLFLMSTPFTWTAGLALALSGFVCGNVVTRGSTLGRQGTGVALGICLLALAGFCIAGTVAMFATPSVIMIFPGTVVAFAAGQLVGMVLPRLA